jgi:DNA-binding NtrC family response regulator
MSKPDATRCPVCTAIVEDEQDLILLYRQIFACMGLPVCFAADNGIDAFAQFNECAIKPRVVLMDNRLPGMSGIEVTKEMLRIEPATRVIFLSADTGAQEDAMNAGAFHFLLKPAGISEIINTVWKALVLSPVTRMSPEPHIQGEIGGL